MPIVLSNLLKMNTIEDINQLIENFNNLIDLAINNVENVDEILIDSFTRFREDIKEWKGKAPLITGILEFLYFEFTKRYLQKYLKILLK